MSICIGTLYIRVYMAFQLSVTLHLIRGSNMYEIFRKIEKLDRVSLLEQ